MNNNIEIRAINSEIRANKETRTIEGYAIVFDSLSDNLGGFVEEIKQSAVTPELINKSDIKLLYNHNEQNGVLARSKNGKGTLAIDVDNRGVKFTTQLPNTQLGNDILESVIRGDLDACSFSFNLSEGMDRWEKVENFYKRTITSFNELFDFSIVVTPAYQATSVSARSMDKLNELKELEKVEDLLELDVVDNKEFDEYYKTLVRKYLKK